MSIRLDETTAATEQDEVRKERDRQRKGRENGLEAMEMLRDTSSTSEDFAVEYHKLLSLVTSRYKRQVSSMSKTAFFTESFSPRNCPLSFIRYYGQRPIWDQCRH